MEDIGSSRNNYVFTLIKFIFFLVIFCFMVELTKGFWQELRGKESFNLNILVLSILSSFAFYTFLADLNGSYKRMQSFFFRTSFFSFLLPSALILLAVGYFFMPKILGATYNRNVFVFAGGFALTAHLTFVARETKGHNFTAVINYLFIFSILYILNLILFGAYLRITFNVHLGKIVIMSAKNSAILIQNIFTQILR